MRLYRVASLLILAAAAAMCAAAPADTPAFPGLSVKAVARPTAPMPREIACCDGGGFVGLFQEKVQEKPKAAKAEKYATGYKPAPPAVLKARHAAAAIRHNGRVASLPNVTAAKFDCRDFGWAPAMKDQGPCGSCYQFSGMMTCTGAFYKAGYKAQIGKGFAEQYGMDCHNWGGCSGGDELDIISWCKTNGLPTESDYGPYLARSSQCRLKSTTKMWKIADWGYCSKDQGSFGVAAYQDIKNCISAYGPISVAGSADGGFMNYQGGLFKGNSHNVDHAILCIGWDDTKSTKGSLLLQNQWSSDWGEEGYMWCEYGANDWGTEAIWTVVAPLPPPPPPPTPFAVTLTSTAVIGPAPLSTTFSYTSTGGTATSAAIDFGDNTSATVLPATHTYTGAGTYVATLVAQSTGGAATSKVTITVSPIPGPTPQPGDLGDVSVSQKTGTITISGPWIVKGGVSASLSQELLDAGVSQDVANAILILIDAAKKKAEESKAKPGPGGWYVPRRRFDKEPLLAV